MQAQSQAGLSHGLKTVPSELTHWALQGKSTFPPSREHHPALLISTFSSPAPFPPVPHSIPIPAVGIL